MESGTKTVAEFASSADEDRAAYNDSRDEAFRDAEALAGLLDEAYDEYACGGDTMRCIADRIAALLVDARRVLGGSAAS